MKYPAAMQWNPGEREEFAASMFPPDEIFYYVDKALFERCRDHPKKVTSAEWKSMANKDGSHNQVCVAFGPPKVAVAGLAALIKKYSTSYWTMRGALSAIDVADLVPLLIDQTERHAADAIEDLGPVDCAELALPISGLLTATPSSKPKKLAAAWLARHPRAAAVGVLEHVFARGKKQLAAIAALQLLVKEGAGPLIKSVAVELKLDVGKLEERVGSLAAVAPKKKIALSHAHVGRVYYKAHHVTPLVLGDLAVMAEWRGAPDGNDDFETVKLSGGTVVVHDLDLLAPEVFVAAAKNEVILLAKHGVTLKEASTDEELQAVLDAPLLPKARKLGLGIDSGALVVSVGYNATPVEGAKPKGLDERCFHAGVPRLPKRAPAKPVYKTELSIIPLKAGRYEVVDGRTAGNVFKTVIRPATK